MKVVLSRKGFDSTAGSYPSPVIDGIPLSLPIPDNKDKIKYSDLIYKNGKSYFDLMTDLGMDKYDKNSICHLDPDLKFDILEKRENTIEWRGTLGQMAQAQKHLENKGVGRNDLFLFFGWFKETENKNGKINFKRNSKYPDGFHLIFGYLEIGEIIKTATQDPPLWLQNHPHFSREGVRKDKSNTVYIAKKKLALRQNQAGFGIFKFSEKLILTKEGHPKSHWDIDKIKELRNLSISYHAPQSWKEDYFQSAGRGQEFVIEENERSKKWAENLLKNQII
ncbi:MAG: hypothetical protein WC682_05425 [Parcubacteria group bacterium]|jgi:hypothetical protein